MAGSGVEGAQGVGGDGAAPGDERIDGIALGSSFASELPELAVPWRAMRPEEPALLALNEPLVRELALDPERLRGEPGIRFLLGNALAEGSVPVAQAYAGHQFGAYVPRLGDGRALLLGEATDTAGRLRDIHLKGSGRTPFARADGFAVIGPMLRECLMGEAMHALGIPTTRALAVVATGRRVVRDDVLDVLPGAVLVRIAASHLRVGTFQLVRSTGDLELLRRLADFAIDRHYPFLADVEDPYSELLSAVVGAQAKLVASWMLVGFVHGVMNTDNTTISGETIDYGPCAFIDAYDPASVFSSIDHRGRYAYGNQPGIILWNLTRFAETLLPLLAPEEDAAKEIALRALSRFTGDFDEAWIAGMRAKLGLGGRRDPRPAGTAGAAGRMLERVDDEIVTEIATGLLGDLQEGRVDYTRFFRALAEAARGREASLRELLPEGRALGGWFRQWRELSPDSDAMDSVNPAYIPRNHLVDEALEAANAGDLGPFERILDVVSRPFEERQGLERYALPAPPGSGPFITYCGT